ncbi:MAG: UDP-N-acetylmuramate dehydrogenase [Rhodospirillales bacterium]|nr:MAG: UDP-N-acetylmuramate dehydrogenase [Rhodospirillales bacterium]
MTGAAPSSLLDRLPPVRGRYTADVPLAPVTWFKVGGPAEVVFRPADEEDLAAFLAARPADVPVTVLGVASNVLVRDGGVPGVVVRLGRGFAGITVTGEEVLAGAAALDINVARVALDHGLQGLEFLAGIPGTIGGALRMNAGAFGAELGDVLTDARVLDPLGGLHWVAKEDLGLGYRRCAVPDDWIFVAARLRGLPGDSAVIARRMHEIRELREASQPTRTPTGGSTFTNPPGARAWELIDQAGCRGLRIGGAQVSEKHCNFLVNTGDATATDLEALGEAVRERVRERSGVALKWEIRRIGKGPHRPDEGGGDS